MFVVTRLANGWLFTKGSLLKTSEIAHFGGYFFPLLVFALIVTQNGLGYIFTYIYILGDLFTNSSGHPGYVPTYICT
jgi:hypothetical protein